MLIFIIILTFASIALGVMSVFLLTSRSTSTVAARLETMDPSLALVENNPVTTRAERVAEPLNRLVPISAIDAAKLQKQLLQAGFPSQDAVIVFRAIQVTLVLGLPIAFLTLCMLLNTSARNYVIFGTIGAVIGLYLPRYVLWKKTLSRQQRIRWALADTLDLMVIAVEAGLGLNAALNRVGDELKTTHPDLHNELELVNLEIRVGRGRDEALRHLAAGPRGV